MVALTLKLLQLAGEANLGRNGSGSRDGGRGRAVGRATQDRAEVELRSARGCRRRHATKPTKSSHATHSTHATHGTHSTHSTHLLDALLQDGGVGEHGAEHGVLQGRPEGWVHCRDVRLEVGVVERLLHHRLRPGLLHSGPQALHPDGAAWAEKGP